MVELHCEGFYYAHNEEVSKRQERQNIHATTPVVPNLQREGSVTNIRKKITSVTRSTFVTPLQGNDMVVRGNASETAMLRLTPFVSCVMKRECL